MEDISQDFLQAWEEHRMQQGQAACGSRGRGTRTAQPAAARIWPGVGGVGEVTGT